MCTRQTRQPLPGYEGQRAWLAFALRSAAAHGGTGRGGGVRASSGCVAGLAGSLPIERYRELYGVD